MPSCMISLENNKNDLGLVVFNTSALIVLSHPKGRDTLNIILTKEGLAVLVYVIEAQIAGFINDLISSLITF